MKTINIYITILALLNMSCVSSFKSGDEGGQMHYYTFEIDGKKVGYYEEKDDKGVFYSNARMEIGGEVMENPFWIKHENGQVLAYKFGESDFIEFKQESNVFPSSSIPLLLASLKSGEVFTYRSFHEGAGKVEGAATLTKTENKIEEMVNGSLTRYFIMENGKVLTYCWGGTAFSHKVSTKEEALIGTVWE